VIKVEKDQFEMSPLPPAFDIDFNDTHKHFGGTEPNIKVWSSSCFSSSYCSFSPPPFPPYPSYSPRSPPPPTPQVEQDIDFDQADFDSLEGLIQNYEMTQQAVCTVQEDVKPDINKNNKDLNSENNTAAPSIPTGICLRVSSAPSHLYSSVKN
jgi:hypothetical protein